MRNFIFRLIRLVFGLFICAVAIVMTIKANIGYAPWDVFHAGLAHITQIAFGTMTIIVGFAIVLIDLLLGEKIGIGTLLNMYLIGVFINWLLALDIPLAPNFIVGIVVMATGLWLMTIGLYFYIGSGFGSGPRDSLMVSINRKTGLPIGISRAVLEFAVAAIGWMLGGLLGIGTIISALLIGVFVQWTFTLLKFEPAKVEHETIVQTFTNLKHILTTKK